ncbi:hypothetical protein GCM10010156_13890 [Planobispora rosea]|uniref:Uncharacterized protein n=1 Tax=Planobispora rosea TaxID=35762 RepID=A0A8J3WB55_PLARO|nr:hypothetical protein GCM10010156_13890 [Planobispora rosea]GIH83539.1 hypothetical protein Pro02_19470 [Planobispora rosea]
MLSPTAPSRPIRCEGSISAEPDGDEPVGGTCGAGDGAGPDVGSAERDGTGAGEGQAEKDGAGSGGGSASGAVDGDTAGGSADGDTAGGSAGDAVDDDANDDGVGAGAGAVTGGATTGGLGAVGSSDSGREISPGSTRIVTPSDPDTPRATTSITRRTALSGRTTGAAGRIVIERIAGPPAAGCAVAAAGTAQIPAATDARRTLTLMITTLGSGR